MSLADAEGALDDDTAVGALRDGIQMAAQLGQYVFTPYQWIQGYPPVLLSTIVQRMPWAWQSVFRAGVQLSGLVS